MKLYSRSYNHHLYDDSGYISVLTDKGFSMRIGSWFFWHSWRQRPEWRFSHDVGFRLGPFSLEFEFVKQMYSGICRYFSFFKWLDPNCGHTKWYFKVGKPIAAATIFYKSYRHNRMYTENYTTVKAPWYAR